MATMCLALVACREEEQGRVLQYEMGVYSGKPMPILDTTLREELRARAQHQDF